MDWQFACPACRADLSAAGSAALRCTGCGRTYACTLGIWRLLPDERLASYQKFMQEYQTVRLAEGRGSPDGAYYRALPFAGRSRDWAIRARSFRALVERVIGAASGLRVLDLGAGNGWLSYRLAERGHTPAAVDLLVNPLDGLGAHGHYPAQFTPVQAEFDRLPFAAGQADLAIFNASFHYSTDYAATLGEALRVLRPGGRAAIVDSPIYRDRRSGEQMVREREAEFTRRFGFPSNALASENFLTYERLKELEQAVGVRFEAVRVDYGLRWRLRPWIAKLRRQREPAQLGIWVVKRA